MTFYTVVRSSNSKINSEINANDFKPDHVDDFTKFINLDDSIEVIENPFGFSYVDGTTDIFANEPLSIVKNDFQAKFVDADTKVEDESITDRKVLTFWYVRHGKSTWNHYTENMFNFQQYFPSTSIIQEYTDAPLTQVIFFQI